MFNVLVSWSLVDGVLNVLTKLKFLFTSLRTYFHMSSVTKKKIRCRHTVPVKVVQFYVILMMKTFGRTSTSITSRVVPFTTRYSQRTFGTLRKVLLHTCKL